MKKLLTVLCGIFLVFSVAGPVSALQFSINNSNSDIDPKIDEDHWYLGFPGSFVSGGWKINTELISYADPFDLHVDGASITFNFARVTLTGYGLGAYGSTDFQATLDIGGNPYVANGFASWSTFATGAIDVGCLRWDTDPGIIKLANGDYFDVFFKPIKGISLGKSEYNIEAVVTGHSASVPEPATMLLMGAGLLGLGIIRKKFKKA